MDIEIGDNSFSGLTPDLIDIMKDVKKFCDSRCFSEPNDIIDGLLTVLRRKFETKELVLLCPMVKTDAR